MTRAIESANSKPVDVDVDVARTPQAKKLPPKSRYIDMPHMGAQNSKGFGILLQLLAPLVTLTSKTPSSM